MKATIIFGVVLALAAVALASEPTALAAGLAASQHVVGNQEPAWMVLSGASLLTIASLVRRYVP